MTTPKENRWVWLNGRLISHDRATVSVFDRSFQLGDGVFETIRFSNSQPILWQEHWKRFLRAAKLVSIRLPWSEPACLKAIADLAQKNRAATGAIRLHLSRGVGSRGYSPTGADRPTLVISLHPLDLPIPGQPLTARLQVSPFRINPGDPLLRAKSASRLLTVLAKQKAEQAGYDDALFLDLNRNVLEATSSNIFWFNGDRLITPPLGSGILPGTTRREIIALARRFRLKVLQQIAPLDSVLAGDGAFLSASTRGIIEITGIGRRRLPFHPMTRQLHLELETRWTHPRPDNRQRVP